MKTLDQIRKDLNPLRNQNAVLYGSYLTKYYTSERSDIDVAVITKKKEKETNYLLWKSLMGEFDDRYDIKIFELIPLYVQIEVIQNYQVLFGNKIEISEYFFQYRKLWDDMKHRIESNQFTNITEKIELLEKRNSKQV